MYLSIYLSIYLSVCLSVYLSFYLSIYLSIQSINLINPIQSHPIPSHPSIHLSTYLKRSKPARLPQRMDARSSKSKQVCETILRDFLHFELDNVKKKKHFCETSFKNGKLSAELTASYPCVLWFFHPTHLKSTALARQNHLSKLENLILQNATCQAISALTS